jgi:uncharacterized tellurite resistance protein B-like protein
MFERFLAFLNELSGGGSSAASPDRNDPAVAAAALLFHVMDADGVRAKAERAVIEREIAAEFSLQADKLSAILAAAEEAERDSVDLYSFTSVLTPRLDREGRIAFIGMMWEIVYADGERHEVEDNVVWRVAELMGVDRADRIRLRQEVAKRAGASGADNGAAD